MMQCGNVLSRRSRPTTKSYREAVKKIVLAVQAQHSLNDPELAERLGCSSGTVENARKEVGNLNGVTLANIEYEFGPAALDPFLALGGSRAVPRAEVFADDGTAPLLLSEVLHRLLAMQVQDSPGGRRIVREEVTPHLALLIEARTKLDGLIDLAEGNPLKAVKL
jgi:hypothetical protein